MSNPKIQATTGMIYIRNFETVAGRAGAARIAEINVWLRDVTPHL